MTALIIILGILFWVLLSLSLGTYLKQREWRHPIFRNSQSDKNEIAQEKFQAKHVFRIIFGLPIILLLAAFFLPFIFQFLHVERQKAKLEREERDIERKIRFLHTYINHLPGVGVIKCKECGHEEGLTACEHGIKDDPWYTSGQCQNCGVIHKLKMPDPDLSCYCGNADVRRDKPLMCPKCGSWRVTYHMKFIT